MTCKGFHHITMMCKDAHETVRFYRDILGLHLVKQTVNFDDPFTYHLYFGDEKGSPGTLLTFFPFENIQKAVHGNNEIRSLVFAIDESSESFWKERLLSFNISFTEKEVFSQKRIIFTDLDGLELVLELQKSSLPNMSFLPKQEIKGLLAISLHVPELDDVSFLLQYFNYTFEENQGNIHRFLSTYDDSYVDVVIDASTPHTPGYGSVHHIAFHSADDMHEKCREDIQKFGYNITPVIDRQYFKSLYFRTKDFLLFEIATTSPGMFIDEEKLGSELCIPLQHKHIEGFIRKKLKTL